MAPTRVQTEVKHNRSRIFEVARYASVSENKQLRIMGLGKYPYGIGSSLRMCIILT